MSHRFAVLGDPVGHSRSPQIHSAIAQIVGLEISYERVRANTGTLADAVTELRAGRWDGLNITMPLKGPASALADRVSPQVRASGSANTLSFDGTHVFGHSTDAMAFRDLIEDERFETAAAYLILGAGGSARAALAALDDTGPVYVSARRSAQAEELTSAMGGEVVRWEAAVSGGLVINTTPLGMAGEQLPDGVLEVAAGLIDLPYRDRPTPAVTRSGKLGLAFSDGHEFLLRQAIESFRIWTGSAPELKQVAALLENA